jgi:hypothetical protein
MPPKLKDDKWYRLDVQVPDGQGVTAADVQQFLAELAAELENSEHGMKVRRRKPAGFVAPAGAARTTSTGVKPLYFCHNKF